MPIHSASRIDAADIARAEAANIADIASERGFVLKKTGHELVGPCPHCGGHDRFAVNITENLFNCRGCGGKGRGAIAFVRWLDGSGFREAVAMLIGERQKPRSNTYAQVTAKTSADDRRQHDKARWLWSQHQPITGTIAEKYLRQARQITCPLPPTLGFLPSRKSDHHPALISAFGLCTEVEPGVISAPGAVVAVHLTLLKPDGSGKAEIKPNKIMIGSPGGKPIVIAPPNDLLGLAITEGIEEALTVHQALCLGAWAAGSAPHMAKLSEAIPDWIDCVSIFADADQAGESNSALLAERLSARGIHAEVLPLAEVRS